VPRAEQAYPVIATRLDRRTEEYRANEVANRAAIDKLTAALAQATVGGGDKYTSRHKAAGKLLPRERVELLLDRDSYFLELCPLAGKDLPGHTPGASLVGGIGLVSGVECLITASESTVKGGAISEASAWKSGARGGLPADTGRRRLWGSGRRGADRPNRPKSFGRGGRGSRALTRRSEQRIPTICLVFGSSTAGGAYFPGMSDYVVMVENQAQVYLAGPPLVKMATGEESDHEELGGAEMHARISGVADYLAHDEPDAIRIGREIVAHLDWKKGAHATPRPVEPPRYAADELLGLVSPDIKVPFDQREVIARIVDGSRFSEFKPLYGSTLICGWAHIHGMPVGILANNGVLVSESAQKGAQFIQLCNQSDVPLVFLQNITGFMVGKKLEQEGIIKHGAKLINAVSNSTVPAITIMTGASYGAGTYARVGRGDGPGFRFTCPNHRIGVMGGKQLAGVPDITQRDAAAKRGETVDEPKLAMMKAMTEGMIDKESDPYFATARLWDDGIIDPRDTRTVIAISLSAAYSKPFTGTTSWGVFRH